MSGHYDKGAGTVSFECEDLEQDGLKRMIRWLEQVHTAMRETQTWNDGGIRWEFQRGHADAPVARRMHGKTQMADLGLVTIRPRKACSCGACGQEIDAGAMCWKQKPGQYSGHSRDRFCVRCVQAGGAPKAPKLQLIAGGLA